MGADMTLCCAPAFRLTPERQQRIDDIVRGIPEEGDDLKELMEQLGYESATDARQGILRACRTAQDEHREIVTLNLPGCAYHVRAAGGLSWGDPPSEGCAALRHLELCPPLWQLLEKFARQDALITCEDPADMAVGVASGRRRVSCRRVDPRNN